MISSYAVNGDTIEIKTPYHPNVVETCRKWAGKFSNGRWVVSLTRLEAVQERLGKIVDDQIEVEVGPDNFDDGEYRVGWYILAGRRSRDSQADVYADLVGGEIPASGGSVKHPRVQASNDVRFRLTVPRGFAVARGLQIISAPQVDIDELIAEQERLTVRLKEIDALLKSQTLTETLNEG